jgi:ribosomal protein S25
LKKSRKRAIIDQIPGKFAQKGAKRVETGKKTRKKGKKAKNTFQEEVISDEELFRRIRGEVEPRPSIVPSYGAVPLAEKACKGYGKDVPNLENPPKWGIRMWSSVRRDPPNSDF